MNKYEIVFYWRNDDQAFVVEAAELSGRMARGFDQESTLGNIKDAMQIWIDRARDLRRPVPERKDDRVMLA